MPAYLKYIEINEAEMACRMFEAMSQVERPSDMTADEAVAAMDPDIRATFLRMSRAVRDYWFECIDAAETIQ